MFHEFQFFAGSKLGLLITLEFFNFFFSLQIR